MNNMTKVDLDLISMNFAAEYPEAPDSALNRLGLLLGDERLCRSRLALLRHARDVAPAGLAGGSSRKVDRRERDAVLGPLLDGTLASALADGRVDAGLVDRLTRDAQALWDAHEKFIAFDAEDETNVFDDAENELEDSLAFEALEPSIAAAYLSPSSTAAGYTALVSQGKWELLGQTLPAYLRAILDLVDRPEEWVDDWMEWLETEVRGVRWGDGSRFRDLLLGWTEEYLRQRGRPLAPSEVPTWNWGAIIALGALISRLGAVSRQGFGSKFVGYSLEQAGSAAELRRLEPSPKFSPLEAQLFPLFREQVAEQVVLEEKEARRLFELDDIAIG